MLIGLAGRAGSGKDTVSAHLARKYDFSTLALATPIKDGLIAMFGILGVTRESFEHPAKEAVIRGLTVSPRVLAQTLGTEWGRTRISSDIWIQHAHVRMRQIMRYSQRIVVTDVRFPNEAKWIHDNGGRVWHLRRSLPSNVSSLHASEAGLPVQAWAGDEILDNNAGLDQLYAVVDRAYEAARG